MFPTSLLIDPELSLAAEPGGRFASESLSGVLSPLPVLLGSTSNEFRRPPSDGLWEAGSNLWERFLEREWFAWPLLSEVDVPPRFKLLPLGPGMPIEGWQNY